MKAGEPDQHTWLAPALARRAHTSEKKGEKRKDGMEKSMFPFFFEGAEQAMDVWTLLAAYH
jgi:hypothetical protein